MNCTCNRYQTRRSKHLASCPRHVIDNARQAAYVTLHHARCYLAAAYADVNPHGSSTDSTIFNFDTLDIKEAWKTICHHENDAWMGIGNYDGERMLRTHGFRNRNTVDYNGEPYKSTEMFKCCHRVIDAGQAMREQEKDGGAYRVQLASDIRAAINQ